MSWKKLPAALLAVIAVTCAAEMKMFMYFYTERDLRRAVATADLIAVGTAQLGWPLPWVDGWHYRPSLRIQAVLFGGPAGVSIALPAWQRPFGVTELLCNDFHNYDGRPGVWFLKKHSGSWQLVRREGGPCEDPFVVGDSREIRDAIRRGKLH
ncbi:MAG: hypothetical protein JWO48_1030 [Bryobacterales bacterium]|nr:hypothetical protein [Bryobacterales bacterium]